jgi:capsular polysaccharide biosynthesis protein
MELRDYLAIIHRRWPIVAVLTLLALVAAAVFAVQGPRSYEATTRLAVSVGTMPVDVDPVENRSPYPYFREYYSWLASEYFADDLSEIIKSGAFAADVAASLGQGPASATVKDVVRVRKTHRILEITVQAGTPDEASRFGMAIANVVQTQGSKYLAQLATPQPMGQVVLIDPPTVRASTTTGSRWLDLALRGGLGLLVGLLLAVVLEYLDSRLRTAREVEQYLGLPVLGEIPSR